MTDIDPAAPGLSRALAARLAALSWGDLPPGIVETVKLFVLDTLGVIGGAARAPGIAELNRALRQWETGGKATSLLGGFRASPPAAALANGAASHALDFDDQHDPARVHVFCVNLPAALAAAEARGGVTGQELIAALAVGVDLHCRLGLAAYNCLGKGWHPTTMLGALAAAATAGKIFGLDAAGMLNALGIAYHQTGGTAQSIADGALTKRMGPGFAARNGVTAAHLASSGLTGPSRFLEGAAGLFALHERGEIRAEALTVGLGSDWRTGELSMKPFPCCRCTHSTIQLGTELREAGIGADDIESGVILLSRVDAQTVGAPFDPPADPVVHAQFNAAYVFIRAVIDGGVDLTTFRPEKIRAADSALAKRLRVEVASDIEPTAIGPARVRVTLKSGRIVEGRRDVMKGSPEEKMSEAETLGKFRSCLEFGLGASSGAADRLAEVVLGLDKKNDAASLVAAFPTRQGEKP